ncbi:hypothetical protein U1Q18_043226, partial [Sarracenia purpurea var. burkii]
MSNRKPEYSFSVSKIWGLASLRPRSGRGKRRRRAEAKARSEELARSEEFAVRRRAKALAIRQMTAARAKSEEFAVASR